MLPFRDINWDEERRARRETSDGRAQSWLTPGGGQWHRFSSAPEKPQPDPDARVKQILSAPLHYELTSSVKYTWHAADSLLAWTLQLHYVIVQLGKKAWK